jgi:hypothetical protein
MGGVGYRDLYNCFRDADSQIHISFSFRNMTEAIVKDRDDAPTDFLLTARHKMLQALARKRSNFSATDYL